MATVSHRICEFSNEHHNCDFPNPLGSSGFVVLLLVMLLLGQHGEVCRLNTLLPSVRVAVIHDSPQGWCAAQKGHEFTPEGSRPLSERFRTKFPSGLLTVVTLNMKEALPRWKGSDSAVIRHTSCLTVALLVL